MNCKSKVRTFEQLYFNAEPCGKQPRSKHKATAPKSKPASRTMAGSQPYAESYRFVLPKKCFVFAKNFEVLSNFFVL